MDSSQGLHCKKRKRTSIFSFFPADNSMESSPVTLRNFQKSDVDDFMEWATYDDALRFESRKEAKIYIKKVAMRHPWYKAICINGRAVGGISLSRGRGESCCRAEIGYLVARKLWGKGVASEAVKLCLSTAFTCMPGLERIEAFVMPENVASQKVLEKAGFVKEGLLRKYFTTNGKTGDFYSYRFLFEDLPHPV